ncbi:cytochrome P450 [Gymnopilus junonius]|uniref:Cytochrome P450 n=1 Tax=Gymnopilus junonius TaxID=109634 RepID=A0A9P5TIQ0_GYMJU|nr:cytochrome P450 [Gymnopilus junonius]
MEKVALLLAGGLLIWTLILQRQQKHPPLPPGPPADPIIGHLRMIPKDDPGGFFYELSKKYGKIAHLRIPGRTMIILNSAQAAMDLLDKRSGIYSDRITSHVFELMGWAYNVGFFSYGERFRKHRRMLNDYLNHKKCQSYLPLQALEGRRLVQNLLYNPDRFGDHLNRFSTSLILRIAYGHEIVSGDDPFLKIVSDVEHCLSECAAPGSNLVDLMPISYFNGLNEGLFLIVKDLPSWFPGTYPANQARSYRHFIDLMHDYPVEHVQKQMVEGTAQASFLRNHLEGLQREGSDYPYTADDIKGVAAVMYTGGADTTWSTLSIFMLAMVLYPSVQAQAQEEIDESIGRDRLPNFNDRPNLPYIEGVLQETYRWNNTAPTGIPHCSMEDDIYNGMFIPKGSVIVANTRGITLDGDVYKEPRIFDPSRYLRGEPYPVGHFGFGRRICPGRHLADSSVWIAIASILAVFNISPVEEADGTPILPKEEFISGIASHPKPFKCRIVPRNEKARANAENGYD